MMMKNTLIPNKRNVISDPEAAAFQIAPSLRAMIPDTIYLVTTLLTYTSYEYFHNPAFNLSAITV